MQAHQQREIVVLTGATGFIGSALIKRLADRYTVVALDRAGPPEPAPPAHAIAFDLGSDQAVGDALAQVRERFGPRIASVLHLAAYYDISGEPSPLYEEVNVQGTRRLVDALQGIEVEQFIHASTMLVHQPTASPDALIAESSPLAPPGPIRSRSFAQKPCCGSGTTRSPWCCCASRGSTTTPGARPSWPSRSRASTMHRLLSHVYPGLLCAGQSFLHADDLCEAIARLVERRQVLPAEMAMLVGEPEALGYAEVQNIIGEALHGEEWRTVRIPQPLAKAGVWLQDEVIGADSAIKPWMVEEASDHYVLDISKARRLLEWEPRHRLRETLPRMVAALRRDPPGWYRANMLNAALVAWNGPRKVPPASRAHGTSPPSTPQDAAAHHGHGSGPPVATADAEQVHGSHVRWRWPSRPRSEVIWANRRPSRQ